MEETIKSDGKNVSEINYEKDDSISSADSMILYLTFMLGSDTFGIQVGEIREVIEYKKVFKVPGVPDFIKGVINLRGEVVPVIDLNSRFYNKPAVVMNTTSIVVVEIDDDNNKIPVGVIIDAVKAVTGISENSIETVPEIGSRIKAEFIHGIGKMDEQFVILLKIQNILNLTELANTESGLN